MPALVLNYFGQGALLLDDPAAIKNPFYLLAPTWALIPLVILATCAAVIASQAVISGAFSLTRAAIQMGYCPRLTIEHTSEREIGQIYVPFINWVLFIAVILLVAGFRHSDNLGGAYGIAVTLAMLIDSILILFVMRRMWNWPGAVAFAIAVPLMLIDLAFLTSNALKIPSGGWFPIVIGITRVHAADHVEEGSRRVDAPPRRTDRCRSTCSSRASQLDPPTRVPGTAVFLTSGVNSVPHSLLHNLKHNKVLHERVVFLTIVSRDIPYVPRRRALRDQTARRRLPSDHGVLRLLRRRRRAAPARAVRPRRVRVQDDGDLVLRIARIADRNRRAGYGEVARAIVRVDVEERDESV